MVQPFPPAASSVVSGPRLDTADRTTDPIQRRLTLLVRAGELFHRSLDLEQTLSNVARTAVESFAELCLFDLIDENTRRLYVSVGAHRDPDVESSLKALVTPLLQAETRGIHPARHVAQTGEPFFVPVFDERTLLEHASSDEHERFMRQMKYRSKIVVPVVAHGEIFGALTFVRTDDAEPFDVADMQAAEELGRRAGLAVANAKQFRREQHVAETLQRAFLNDELPSTETMQFNAVYQGAQVDSSLGGDWYDAFAIGDRVVLTIGDVTGKGVDAARLMVQLRQWVRMAAVVSTDPGEIMTLLNRALILEGRDELATAFVAVIDRAGRAMDFASAGHPPGVVKHAEGRVGILGGTACVPLGVDVRTEYDTNTVSLDDATLLMFYTDGLTEIDRDPVQGEAAIEALLATDEVLFAANPARYVTRLIAGKQSRDDMAVLTVRLGRTYGRWAFDVADSAAAYAIKRDFVAAVRAHYGGDADAGACEIIFSELVGNALRYAPGRLSLGLSVDERGVWLHVMDDGPGYSAQPTLPADVWSESGRGLFLVRALSDDFTIQRLPAYGTYVRVLLPRG
ncbi:MAG TPA: SpoIIE family protein phosphatase [Candidatus Elarobacter sp.]|jgi:serine phosphatase RsbU (regulator of sigma subunit)/anti-sigma regulatory factor (Ser/Thr protein kinase)|nr:SpoIIE family protein phosphatase [Candidatus Elarobacter sp.]